MTMITTWEKNMLNEQQELRKWIFDKCFGHEGLMDNWSYMQIAEQWILSGVTSSPCDDDSELEVWKKVNESIRRKENLERRVDDLPFSVRAENCFRREGIVLVRDLVQRSENDLLKIEGLGRKLLNETKEQLGYLGLSLARELEPWQKS